MKYHYVYKVNLPETGEFYIGSRSCDCLPLEDIKYKGSMKAWKVDKNQLIKEILMEFTDRDLAILFESELIKKHIDEKLNRNYHIPPFHFHTTGLNCSGEKNGFFHKTHTEESKKKTSEKTEGINNPSYGKKWIHDENNNIKYVKKEEVDNYLKIGWILGTGIKNNHSLNRLWINNGIINKLLKKEDISEYLNNGWVFGRILSEESLNIIKKANLGKKISDENKKLISLVNKNKIVTQVTKDKMSVQFKNRIWIHKDDKNKYIKKDILQKFLDDNWIIGMKKESIEKWLKNRKKRGD